MLIFLNVKVVAIVFQLLESKATENCFNADHGKEHKGYSHDEAQRLCRDEYGTELAAIHTERDFEEAQTLCGLNGDDCWIGSDDLNEFGFEGTNSNHSTVCTQLSWSNEYKSQYAECDEDAPSILCNAPSVLCSEWQSITESASYNEWVPFAEKVQSDTKCALSFSENTHIAIPDRQWLNGNESLMIEYMFSFDVGESGVTIHSDCENQFYFVSLRKSSHSEWLTLCLYHQSTNTRSPTLLTAVGPIYVDKENADILMTIHVSNGYMFDVYINEVHQMHFVNSTVSTINSNINGNGSQNGLSGYIGLKSLNSTTTTASWMYIAGTNIYTKKIESDCFPKKHGEEHGEYGEPLELHELHDRAASGEWTDGEMVWISICAGIIVAVCYVSVPLCILMAINKHRHWMSNTLKSTQSALEIVQLTKLKTMNNRNPYKTVNTNTNTNTGTNTLENTNTRTLTEFASVPELAAITRTDNTSISPMSTVPSISDLSGPEENEERKEVEVHLPVIKAAESDTTFIRELPDIPEFIRPRLSANPSKTNSGVSLPVSWRKLRKSKAEKMRTAKISPAKNSCIAILSEPSF